MIICQKMTIDNNRNRDNIMKNKTLSKIISTDEANKIVQQIKDIKSTIKDFERKQEALTQDLYGFMGEHDVLINHETGQEFVTWTYSKGAKRFDSKKLAFEQPNLYEAYCYIGEPIRTLRLVK
jgi:hypothetical protein